VLIYPEGTRFTAAKKRRIVERLRAAGDLAAAERAERLRSVLPPRPGGSSALLEMNVTAQVGADAIFVAHTGFEGGRSFRELWNGALVNRDVWVQFSTVPFAEIPTDPVEQSEWLYDRWESVDDYVVAKQVLST
jgi:1-acyl-sn-glycerol-3-phosphate acyltransferase